MGLSSSGYGNGLAELVAPGAKGKDGRGGSEAIEGLVDDDDDDDVAATEEDEETAGYLGRFADWPLAGL